MFDFVEFLKPIGLWFPLAATKIQISSSVNGTPFHIFLLHSMDSEKLKCIQCAMKIVIITIHAFELLLIFHNSVQTTNYNYICLHCLVNCFLYRL